MGVRLPAEYQEVEYLDSTYDGQYIDTLLTVGNNIKVEVVFQFLADYERNYTTAFGTQAKSFCAQLGTSATKLAVQSWGANHVVTTEDLRNKTTVILEKTNVTINGSSISLSLGNTVPSTTLWLFGKAANASSSGVEIAGGTRIYSVNVYDGEVIRGSFIPCYRKSDDKPGMYDLVSGTFFTNAGTGEFVVGADVIDSISPWLVARRRMLMEKKSDIHELPLIYFKGLDRRYNTYTDMGNRTITAIDLPIKNGQTMVITVPSDIQAAVGAWREDTKELEKYGGWNVDLRYTPTVDVLAKIVFRRSDNHYVTDGEFAGKIDVQIGENIYKS